MWRGARAGTFADDGEDQRLAEFFGGRTGRYLDIGANHPVRINNTYLLYRRGWRGVSVDPIQRLVTLHRIFRHRDVALRAGVGVRGGASEFFEMRPDVYSTFDPAVARAVTESGRARLVRQYTVPILTVTDLVLQHFGGASPELLLIDVEGREAEVIAGIDFDRVRPEIVCIERFSASGETHEPAIDRFMFNGYERLGDIGRNVLLRCET
jgi:FkbM family methyltransferase